MSLTDYYDLEDKEDRIRRRLAQRAETDGVLVEVIEIEPGSRCPTCNRRKNKPRQKTTPEARKINAGLLPSERADAVEEALDVLQQAFGADPQSYPRGLLLEAMVGLALQHKHEITEYVNRGA